MIKFNLPFLPPSTNSCYYTNRATGGRHKSAPYRQFIKDMEFYMPKESIHGEVEIEYNYYYPLLYKNGNRRKLDMTNFEKALTDTLVHYGIIEDDCWVRDMRQMSFDSTERETWIQIKNYEDKKDEDSTGSGKASDTT